MLEYHEGKIQLTLYKHNGQDSKRTPQESEAALPRVNGIFTTDIKVSISGLLEILSFVIQIK